MQRIKQDRRRIITNKTKQKNTPLSLSHNNACQHVHANSYACTRTHANAIFFPPPSVEHVAPFADVAPRAGLGPDAAEPDDGVGEGTVEGGGAVGQRVHRGARAAVGVEQLVGGQQAAAVLEVAVVLVVEARGRGLVHEHQAVGPAAVGALARQEARVAGVQRRVRRLPRPEAVEPARELAAVRQPHAVRRCSIDHHAHCQTLSSMADSRMYKLINACMCLL
jgi:hypothetical protein